MFSVETPASVCRFGIARGDITPPAGIYHRMWGAATADRATGLHRPLQATAMILQPAEDLAAGDSVSPATSEQVLISLDHCLLWNRELSRLREAVCDGGDVSRDSLLFLFSHTHAAGLMDLDRASLPGGDLIPNYLCELAERVTALVQEARGGLRRATLTYGLGHCDLAAHRDLWDPSREEFVCGFHPEGTHDDTVLVARVTDEKQRYVASIVNYACHPTTLAWDNSLISPDYPGAMRETVEQATGAPCVFLQGASGDLGPREGFVGDVEVAERNGRQLGYAALSAIEALPPPGTRFDYAGAVVSGATIGTWTHVPHPAERLEHLAKWQLRRWTIPLAYRSNLSTSERATAERSRRLEEEKAARETGDIDGAREARALAERCSREISRLSGLPQGEKFPFPATLARIGDVFWLAVEGEPYNVLQRALRERFPGGRIVVMTLANGSRCSYLPPADVYGKGIYQESIALLAPGSLETLIDEIGRQIDAWLLPASQ